MPQVHTIHLLRLLLVRSGAHAVKLTLARPRRADDNGYLGNTRRESENLQGAGSTCPPTTLVSTVHPFIACVSNKQGPTPQAFCPLVASAVSGSIQHHDGLAASNDLAPCLQRRSPQRRHPVVAFRHRWEPSSVRCARHQRAGELPCSSLPLPIDPLRSQHPLPPAVDRHADGPSPCRA